MSAAKWRRAMNGGLQSPTLRVLPGEVELQLALSRRCGGNDLAERAFQTLRSLLPDTDIYVTPAG